MYHREKRALFCDYCTRFTDKNVSSPFIFRFDSHDNVGIRNWKKCPERFFFLFLYGLFFLENKVTKPWFDREIKPSPTAIPES